MSGSDIQKAQQGAKAVSGFTTMGPAGWSAIAIGCGCLAILVIFMGIVALGVFALNNEGDMDTEDDTSPVSSVDATTWQMPDAVLNKITEKKNDYVAAANAKDIPWQLLAGINYRECGLRDCGPSGEEMGLINPDSRTIECPTEKGYSYCLEKIADKLISLSRWAYGVSLSTSSSQEELVSAMIAYNRGKMYVNGGCSTDDSPYAWNQFDENHIDMTWPNNSCEPSSTRGIVNIPAGGFTIYSYLVNNNI